MTEKFERCESCSGWGHGYSYTGLCPECGGTGGKVNDDEPFATEAEALSIVNGTTYDSGIYKEIKPKPGDLESLYPYMIPKHACVFCNHAFTLDVTPKPDAVCPKPLPTYLIHCHHEGNAGYCRRRFASPFRLTQMLPPEWCPKEGKERIGINFSMKNAEALLEYLEHMRDASHKIACLYKSIDTGFSTCPKKE